MRRNDWSKDLEEWLSAAVGVGEKLSRYRDQAVQRFSGRRAYYALEETQGDQCCGARVSEQSEDEG